MTRIIALAATIALAGCQTTQQPVGYVSLKDVPPQRIKAAAPFSIAPIKVIALDPATARALADRMMVELAERGHPVSPTGSWAIIGTVQDQHITWSIRDAKGQTLGTVTQAHPGPLATSVNVVAASAAPNIETFFPPVPRPK
jgi:hypothetical protein